MALCDVNEEAMEGTIAECERAAGRDVSVFSFRCDVSKEQECVSFRDAVLSKFGVQHVNLLFNNAGISGGGLFVNGSREEWETVFNVCWGGVYLMTRVFLPLLIKAPKAHIINTSSVNGFYASLGPDSPHTSYSSAKFAVKGFTEALLVDMRLNAPHVGVSLALPGHIGTDIVFNSQRQSARFGGVHYMANVRKRLKQSPHISQESKAHLDHATDKQLMELMMQHAAQFRDTGMPASDAATFILNAVEAGEWRLLVGNDAELLDAAVRSNPEKAYQTDVRGRNQFFSEFQSLGGMGNSNLEKQRRRLAHVLKASKL